MTVSVIVPAYNASATIVRALQSALFQTLPPLEIIVIDDASTDDTAEICQRLTSKSVPIRVLSSPVNAGPARARNRGILSAQGEFIAILDADDAWRPVRLQRLVSLAREAGADFVADNLILFDAVADREGRLGFNPSWKTKFITVRDLMTNDSGRSVSFDYGLFKPLLRKKFLELFNLEYDESLRIGEDFKLYAELLFCGGRAVITSEAYYVYSTRIGEFSGKWSAFSRSTPDYDHMVRASDNLVSKYRALIDENLERVISERRRYLESIHVGQLGRSLRLSGGIHKYLLFLILNPTAANSLIQGIIARILKLHRKRPG